jgi:predicted MPP superfamily phosphohydrolase
MKQNLVGHLKPKYILWTGDSVSHEVLSQTKEHVLNSIQALNTLLHEGFPETPILTSLGNHDFTPQNWQQFVNNEYSPFLDEFSTIIERNFEG